MTTNPVFELLVGTWQGGGSGMYPTIDPFEFTETLVYKRDEPGTRLHYEQKTWRLDAERGPVPSHWETGFVRALPDGALEWVNVQASGRVEVLRGTAARSGGIYVVTLDSTLLGNDARMRESSRVFQVGPDSLTYVQHMATGSVPKRTVHIRSSLQRGS